MLLHHFTKPDYLPSVAERGLLPSKPDSDFTGDAWVVWLTESASTQWSSADLERARSVGVNTDDWMPGCTSRLTVRIGSHDRKLTRYLPWVRGRHYFGNPPNVYAYEAMGHWWIYQGTITPEKIIEGLL